MPQHWRAIGNTSEFQANDGQVYAMLQELPLCLRSLGVFLHKQKRIETKNHKLKIPKVSCTHSSRASCNKSTGNKQETPVSNFRFLATHTQAPSLELRENLWFPAVTIGVFLSTVDPQQKGNMFA